jgi:YHS domain-containing protein
MKLALLALAALLPLVAQDKSAALNGNDPVLLASQNVEKLGSARITAERGGFTFQFVDAKNKAEFEKNPAKYEIQMGGACARMGAGTHGNPSNYAVFEKKIYIFGSDDCRETFLKNPKNFVGK